MTTADDRDAILKRLRALLSLTVENGASETEAMLAADKAAKLMAEHSLTYTSAAEIELEDYAEDRRKMGKATSHKAKRPRGIHPIKHCLPCIDELCGTKHVYWPWHGDLAFFGPKHATDVAHYFVVIIRRAMDREWNAYRATLYSSVTARKHRASFFNVMALRIARRIEEMAQRKNATVTTGTGLVVVRNAVLERKYGAAYPDVKESKRPAQAPNAGAALAGWLAGDKVDLNQGIEEASERRPKLLEGSQ